MFNKAINLWYYECLGDKDIPEEILSVLEENAIPVYKWATKKNNWTIGNCTVMSEVWSKIFRGNNISAKIINGYYDAEHDPNSGLALPGSSDHVWIEFPSGCIFDPTAGQFKGPISLSNYWLDDHTKAYV